MYDVISAANLEPETGELLKVFLNANKHKEIKAVLPKINTFLKDTDQKKMVVCLALLILESRILGTEKLYPNAKMFRRGLKEFDSLKEAKECQNLVLKLIKATENIISPEVQMDLQNLYYGIDYISFETNEADVLKTISRVLKYGPIGACIAGLGINSIKNRYYYEEGGMIGVKKAQNLGGGSIQKGFIVWKKKVDSFLGKADKLIGERVKKIGDNKIENFQKESKLPHGKLRRARKGFLTDLEFEARQKEWRAIWGNNRIEQLPDYSLNILNLWGWWTEDRGWRLFAYPEEQENQPGLRISEILGIKIDKNVLGPGVKGLGWELRDNKIFVALIEKRYAKPLWTIGQTGKFSGVDETIGKGPDEEILKGINDGESLVEEGEQIAGVAWFSGSLWSLWKKGRDVLGWEQINSLKDLARLGRLGNKRKLTSEPMDGLRGEVIHLERMVREGLKTEISL